MKVVTRLRKGDPMSQGSIRSELEINKCWSEVEIIDFLEEHYLRYVDECSKVILPCSNLKYCIVDFYWLTSESYIIG